MKKLTIREQICNLRYLSFFEDISKNKIFHYCLGLMFLFTFNSCFLSPFKGYKRIQQNVFFKLFTFGEEKQALRNGDLITIDISYSTMNDSIFFHGIRKLKLEDTGIKNSIYSSLIKLHKGDSASFIFRSTDFFQRNLKSDIPYYLKHQKRIKINVKVLEVQSDADYQVEKKQFLKWAEDLNKTEKALINDFLNEQRINISPTPGGMYFVLTKSGTGKNAVSGDLVKIHYEGRFIDGRYFDSTKKNNEPVEFILGQEFIVIKGIEEAVKMMKEGDKALIILPSDLAFGEKGAGEGIVPPFTAIIYEVELLKVDKIH